MNFTVLKLASILLLMQLYVVYSITPKDDYPLGDLKVRSTKTIFDVPMDRCPPVFMLGILSFINSLRSKVHLNPITLDDKLVKEAQSFASNKEKTNWYQPNLKNFGQSAWRQSYKDSPNEVEVGFWSIFTEMDMGGNRLGNNPILFFPKYTFPDKRRSFSPEEWKKVNSLGVGCRTFHSDDSETILFVTIFFDFPGIAESSNQLSVQPTFQFNSNALECPSDLSDHFISIINKQRMKSNYRALTKSNQVSEEAVKIAYTLAKMDEPYQKPLPEVGQFVWSRIFDSSLDTTLSFPVNSPFTDKWGNEYAIPFLVDDKKERQLYPKEWSSAERIGLGCVLFKRTKKDTKVRVQIVMLVPLNS